MGGRSQLAPRVIFDALEIHFVLLVLTLLGVTRNQGSSA